MECSGERLQRLEQGGQGRPRSARGPLFRRLRASGREVGALRDSTFGSWGDISSLALARRWHRTSTQASLVGTLPTKGERVSIAAGGDAAARLPHVRRGRRPCCIVSHRPVHLWSRCMRNGAFVGHADFGLCSCMDMRALEAGPSVHEGGILACELNAHAVRMQHVPAMRWGPSAVVDACAVRERERVGRKPAAPRRLFRSAVARRCSCFRRPKSGWCVAQSRLVRAKASGDSIEAKDACGCCWRKSAGAVHGAGAIAPSPVPAGRAARFAGTPAPIGSIGVRRCQRTHSGQASRPLASVARRPRAGRISSVSAHFASVRAPIARPRARAH